MSNFFEQLMESLKSPKLGEEEKAKIRGWLLSHMKFHPVRGVGTERLIQQRSEAILFNFSLFKTMPLLLVLTLMLGGGVALASEYALPGDILYPIKIGVNEKVLGFTKLSDETRAEWNIKLLSRRLEEAERLVVTNRINANVEAEFESRFNIQAERTHKGVEALASGKKLKAAAEASSEMETALRVHEDILRSLAQEKSSTKGAISAAADSVRLRLGIIADARIKLEREVSQRQGPNAKTAAEAKLAESEKKVTQVQTLLSQKDTYIEANVKARAEVQLKSALVLLEEGKKLLADGAHGQAFVLFQKAHREAEIAKRIVEAKKNFNVTITADENSEIDDDLQDQASTAMIQKASSSVATPPSRQGKEDNQNKKDDSPKTKFKEESKTEVAPGRATTEIRLDLEP